jgi:hypothetical protein
VSRSTSPAASIGFAKCGVEVVDLASKQCIELLAGFIAAHPELWHEDIGQR